MAGPLKNLFSICGGLLNELASSSEVVIQKQNGIESVFSANFDAIREHGEALADKKASEALRESLALKIARGEKPDLMGPPSSDLMADVERVKERTLPQGPK